MVRCKEDDDSDEVTCLFICNFAVSNMKRVVLRYADEPPRNTAQAR